MDLRRTFCSLNKSRKVCKCLIHNQSVTLLSHKGWERKIKKKPADLELVEELDLVDDVEPEKEPGLLFVGQVTATQEPSK